MVKETNTYKCGQCHFEFQDGAKVCQGCNGDIVYGATEHEISEAGKTGAILWGVGTILLFYLLPALLNDWFELDLEAGFGFGLWPFAFAGGAAMVGYVTSAAKATSKLAGQCRTFRR
ncbi:hypothetical protein IVE04_24305 [Pseudomonas mendocina]|jgi:hypothetical protein|nr:hypothetical protein [Pseudomonas mendocina]